MLAVALTAVLLATPAVAGAQVRNASVADPQGDSSVTVSGVRVADVRAVEAFYDQRVGRLTVTFRLYSTLPAGFSADASASIGQGYEGSRCRTGAKQGDIDLDGYFSTYGANSYASGEGVSFSEGSAAVGSDSLEMSIQGAALANLDYRCLSNLKLSVYADNNASSSDEVQELFFVAPPPPPADVGVPSVSWSTPRSGQTVAGFLWEPASLPGSRLCEARASDDVAIERVDFYVDGQFLNTEVNRPYTCIWDTARSGDGSHVLRATAVDFAGKSRSADITVVVRNAGASTALARPPLPPGVQLRPLAAQTAPLIAQPAPVARRPLRASYRLPTKSVRSLRADGLLVAVRCPAACRINLSLSYRGRTVGRGRGSLRASGSRTVRVALTRQGKRRLRRVRSGAFRLRGSVTAGGNRRAVNRSITLRR